MGEDQGTGGTTVSGSGKAPAPGGTTTSEDPEQIREEIEQTREELGDTVEALAEKSDVKRQAKRRLDETKASAAEKKDELFGKAREASPEGAQSAAMQASEKARQNPVPLAVGGAFAVGFLLGRRRSRRS